MPHTTRKPSLLVVLFVCFSLILAGCVTARTKGDRAFDNGNYNEALDYYEELFDEGVKDPELYHRAAKASIAIGDFGPAERYYTLALRYGAGLDAARELAEFYIGTSNYASAVRVYQFLLASQKNQGARQAVYNNLGAALMYAGSPFDAESYLMIAQQMEPEDPFPYLNLGLLYDRHLKQPWLAINFYQCFSKLSPKNTRTQEVRQRTQELRARWAKLYEPDVVDCGQAYSPEPQKKAANLKEILGPPPKEGEEETKVSAPAFEVGSPDGELGTVEVERMVEDSPPRETKEEPTSALQQAKIAHADADHARVIQLLTSLPVSQLGARDKAILGASLMEEKRLEDAVTWLEMSLNEQESPQTVELLVRAYRRGDQKERMIGLCKRFEGREAYKLATEACPKASDDGPTSGTE